MEIHVIAVGKLKDEPIRSACDEYLKRVRPFFRVNVTEVRDLRALRDRAGKTGGHRVLMDERGDLLTSPALASWVGKLRERGSGKPLVLCIGGADGFEDADRRDAERVLSLSKLTLPHRLARLVLLEQVYRAATILAGHPYHHA